MQKVKVLFKYYKDTQKNSWDWKGGAYFLGEKEEVMTQEEYDAEYVTEFNDTLPKFISSTIDGLSFDIAKVPMKITTIEND